MLKKTLSLLVFSALGAAALFWLHIHGYLNQKVEYATFLAETEKRLTGSSLQFADSNPIMVLFHGCGGEMDHIGVWQQWFGEQGFAVYRVNSFAFRDLSAKDVCAGREFYGHERAADVLAALDWIAQQHPHSQLIPIGWSHGGWSVMDALIMLQAGKSPTTLKEFPAASVERIINRTPATVLIYPYCGYLSEVSKQSEWPIRRTLYIGIEGDRYVNEKECGYYWSNQPNHSEWLTATVFTDTWHAFDFSSNPQLNLTFDPSTTRKTKAILLDFFSQLKSG